MTTISFARGIPGPDLLPVDEFGESARLAVERDGRTILNYGKPGGYEPLREWIAERYGVDPARVVVTNGSLQGFNFVARHVLGEGGRVVVEAPSYDRTLAILASLRAEILGVPLADDGLDVGALEEIVRDRRPKLVYSIPTFQNPSGRTLSLENRHRLAEVTAANDFLFYEDDPYGLVRFEGEPLPSVYELTGGRNVVFSSSFSKTVSPGIRVGYLVLPEQLVGPIEGIATNTYISPSVFVEGALFEFLRAGRFKPNLDRVNAGLKERRDAMLESLEREMPVGSSWSRPGGGYFLWLDLPEDVDAAALLERATEAGVTFIKGADFYAGAGGESAARLAFSFATADEIREGIGRLAGLVRAASAVAVS